MKKPAICALMLLLIPGLALAGKVKVRVDFAPGTDFAKFKTFAWNETPDSSLAKTAPLAHSRLKNGIEYYLVKGGFIEAATDPDLRVTYHTSSSSQFKVDAVQSGYRYGDRWQSDPNWPPVGGTTMPEAREYREGTLVVDIWDAREDRLIWRGTAEGAVPDTQAALADKIDKILEEMVEKWKGMRAMMTR